MDTNPHSPRQLPPVERLMTDRRTWLEIVKTDYLKLNVVLPAAAIGLFFLWLAAILIGPICDDYIQRWELIHGTPGEVLNTPVETPTKDAPFMLKGRYSYFSHDYVVTPIMKYTVTGRILHMRRYYDKKYSADVIPLDIGLGWKSFSDKQLITAFFDFTHKENYCGRCLFVSARGHFDLTDMPYSLQRDMSDSLPFSNNHILPASPEIFDKLRKVHAGDIITLTGYTVDLLRRDDPLWQWTTRRIPRKDSNGAWGLAYEPLCDTVYVTDVQKL